MIRFDNWLTSKPRTTEIRIKISDDSHSNQLTTIRHIRHMKILIVGAGGVGGYFGARLTNAGADVTFLLREARHQKIQSQGLTVETPK